MDNQYDENVKMQAYYTTTTAKYNNYTYELDNKITNGTLVIYTQKQLNDTKEEYLTYINKSIENTEKTLDYRQGMANTATNPIEKKYAEISVNISKKWIEAYKITKKIVELWTIEGTYETKRNELTKQRDKILEEIEDLNKQRDEIKLKNPEFNKRIDKLYKEAESINK
nr:hypothetical protein [Methanobrevibacter arboriphilus]